MTGSAGGIRIACAQLGIDIGAPERNRSAALAAIERAAAAGADVIVLPELAVSGTCFADAEELGARAETRAGRTVTQWALAAARLGVIVVGGFPELGDDGRIHNSAVLIDPSGPRAFYRKVQLWDAEQRVFTPGHEPPPVVETSVGRIAVMICSDLELPERVRMPSLAGVDLICAPVNWPASGPPPDGERPIDIVRVQANASVNRVAIAVCDRAATERGVDWVGGSVIIDADGYPVTGLCLGEESLIAGEVDLGASRVQADGAGNDVHGDRRTALYGLAPLPVPDGAGGQQQHQTDRVRVTRWTLPTGASTGPHVHEYDYVVVPVATARMTVHLPDGTTSYTEQTPGVTYVRPAGVEHDVHNDAQATVDFVEVELLEPRAVLEPRPD